MIQFLLPLLLLAGVRVAGATQIPIQNYRDQVYLVPLKVGSQTLHAVLDTGSSDTWIASSNFQCSNPQGCRFGPGYTKSPTFAPIPGQRFSISYAAESVDGIMGLETILLGNVTVKDQAIGVVDKGVWKGDGISSGLVGMAFPGNSAVGYAFKGPEKYSPIFTSMQKKRLVAPLFSIALNRLDEGPGALTLGGLPSGSIKFEDKFTTTKLRYLTFGNEDPNKAPAGSEDPGLYRIAVEGFTVNGKTMAKTQVNVDSGTAFNTLPKDIARAFNNGWTPKAKFDRAAGWTVDCNAKGPKLGVNINGVTFNIESKDLIIPPEQESSKGPCLSGVQEGGPMPGGLLGASFLRGVVAVFDVGKMEMRFANRVR